MQILVYKADAFIGCTKTPKCKGQAVPMVNLLLHCVAHRHCCAILTLDSHFRQMNQLLGSALEIITPI